MPTLLLSGGFDWATPPSWAALAAALSHGSTVAFTSLEHQTYFKSDCARQIADAWLDEPSAPPARACAQSLRKPLSRAWVWRDVRAVVQLRIPVFPAPARR